MRPNRKVLLADLGFLTSLGTAHLTNSDDQVPALTIRVPTGYDKLDEVLDDGFFAGSADQPELPGPWG